MVLPSLEWQVRLAVPTIFGGKGPAENSGPKKLRSASSYVRSTAGAARLGDGHILGESTMTLGYVWQLGVTFLLAMLAFGTLGGCDSKGSSSQRTTHAISDDIDKVIDQAKQVVENLNPQGEKLTAQAQAEVEKLFRLEYKTVELPAEASTDELNAALTRLGNERWDCFAINPMISRTVISCKRPPPSYLRYIPRWFPG